MAKLYDLLYIVTNAAYKFLVLGQIEELGDQFNEDNVLLEPVGKNTLPAICYGVKEIVSRHGDDLVAVFPSDHLLEDGPQFFETVPKGRSLAAEYLLTFGVKPAKPHPGYGYIKPGELDAAPASVRPNLRKSRTNKRPWPTWKKATCGTAACLYWVKKVVARLNVFVKRKVYHRAEITVLQKYSLFCLPV